MASVFQFICLELWSPAHTWALADLPFCSSFYRFYSVDVSPSAAVFRGQLRFQLAFPLFAVLRLIFFLMF